MMDGSKCEGPDVEDLLAPEWQIQADDFEDVDVEMRVDFLQD